MREEHRRRLPIRLLCLSQQLRQLGDVGGDAPSLVAGQTDSSPSMAGIALLMPVNRVGAVEYEIDENNGIKA